MILSDRRKVYYRDNIYCEEGCEYKGYNIEKNLVNCHCKLKPKPLNKIEVIDFDFKKEDLSSFFNIKTYANVACLKCYKLLFTETGFVYNIGNFLLLFLILLFIIIMILFYRKHQSNILSLISRVTKKQEQFNNCKILPKNIEEVKTKRNIKIQNNNSFNYTTKKDSMSDSHRILFKDILSVNDKRKENKENSFNAKNTNILKTNNEETNKDDFKDLNDEEINSLSYEEALIVDKRNFLQYYWSLISRKNLILFSFIPMNDYNLIYIKICIFIISFSLYITVNALFFTDETMHKIYKDKGIFNFIFQLPKIIYSTIISSVINILIKFFALSEKNILKLKQNIKK